HNLKAAGSNPAPATNQQKTRLGATAEFVDNAATNPASRLRNHATPANGDQNPIIPKKRQESLGLAQLNARNRRALTSSHNPPTGLMFLRT
ncbi:hypothetical protein, partial [Rhizobium sp. Leaf386]|uniref:hypothetical protein n=1 Tax=Rhizobium sp. Leaf386 TaxID=1736359 RepID=UPI001AECD084